MADIRDAAWGSIEGTPVTSYTLSNAAGTSMDVVTYGALVTRVNLPDAQGRLADVVLGFDRIEDYTANAPYLGATVGRVANRIDRAEFLLDGRAVRVAANSGRLCLHGGVKAFHKVHWRAAVTTLNGTPALALRYDSPDGEEGFPGRLETTLTFQLTADNRFRLVMDAVGDAPTVVNLAHHGYWNFAGHAGGAILDHVLRIDADQYTEWRPADSIPTGRILPVDGTPLDFRTPTAIGARIAELPPDPVLGTPGGYDLNYVVRGAAGTLRRAARVVDPSSGRGMEVWSTQPGVQLYTSNFLDGTLKGKGGTVYARHAALCLETQHYPDAMHHPHFPSIVLHPGERYHQIMEHRFFA